MANEKLIIDVKINEGPVVRGMRKIGSLFKDLTKIQKKQGEASAKELSARQVANKAAIKDLKDLYHLTDVLAESEQRLAEATDEMASGIRDEIKDAERAYAALQNRANDYVKTMLVARKAAKELREEEEKRKFQGIADVAGYSGKDAGKDLAENFTEALGSLGGGSLKGFASGFAKMLGSAAKGAGGMAMRGGAANAAAGKDPGAMSKAAVGITNMLSKWGPLLSAATGALMGVVKLFLDADAAAKNFNADIMATTSTADFLSSNMNNVAAGGADLNDTLKKVYKSAVDIKNNWTWGIDKEQHAAVISSLGAEGMSLKALERSFGTVGKSAERSEGYVKDWGTMVQMSVGFSRAFSVSLNEITQFQGDMMSEMGMNFDQVEVSFATMLNSAKEAGIGTNKFFAQIREISADINLFNTRIADAAKLMGKLDKVMNPRKASEFFRNISQMMKGMGLVERTKSTLLAGKGKTQALETKDLEGKIEGLAADIDTKLGAGTGDELKKVIKKPKDLMKWMAKIDAKGGDRAKKLDATTRGALLDTARMSDKISKGGLVDIASALKDVSPMTVIDHLDNVAKSMFKKPVEELSDVQRIAFENLTGVNDEQVDQLAKFKASLDMTKETLKAKLEAGTALTEDEVKLLTKLGIDSKSANAAAEVGKTDARKFYDFMDKTQQEALKDGAKMIDWGKKTGEMSVSMEKKLGLIMDYLMGTLSQMFSGIWESILDIADTLNVNPWSDKKDQRKLDRIQAEAIKSGSKDVADMASKAGSAEDFKKGIINSELSKNVDKSLIDTANRLEQAQAKSDKLQEDLAKAQSEEEKHSIEAQLKANEETRGALQEKLNGVTDAIVDQVGGETEGGDKREILLGKLYEAAKKAEVDRDKMGPLLQAIGNGDSFGAALDKAGLNRQEQANLVNALRKELSPEQIGKATADANKALGAGGATPGGAQQQAAQKTEESPPPTPPPPAEPPTPAKMAAVAPASKPASGKDLAEASESQNKTVAEEFDETRRKARQMSGGVALNGPFLKNQFGGQIEDSVYNAASRALFEYWLLSQAEKGDVLDALKRGAVGRDIGSKLAESVKKGQDIHDAMAGMGVAKGNAEGGLVGRPAPGEFMASVKPGETIVPAGGAGGGVTKVVLELKGDMLKQIMRATALNTIAENDRAQARR